MSPADINFLRMTTKTSEIKNIDSYNSNLPDFANVPGTLIGNWVEEAVLRTASGVGRSYPGEHIPRAVSQNVSERVDNARLPQRRNNTFQRIICHAPSCPKGLVLNSAHKVGIPSVTPVTQLLPRERSHQAQDLAVATAEVEAFNSISRTVACDSLSWLSEAAEAYQHPVGAEAAKHPIEMKDCTDDGRLHNPYSMIPYSSTLSCGDFRKDCHFSHPIRIPHLASLNSATSVKPLLLTPEKSLIHLRLVVRQFLESKYGGDEYMNQFANDLGGLGGTTCVATILGVCTELPENIKLCLGTFLESSHGVGLISIERLIRSL